MRISDWSSDVCSSDLRRHVRAITHSRRRLRKARSVKRAARQPSASPAITGTGASASPGDLVVIGKDILELLSSAMYTDPLTIYREYVQTSAEYIEVRRPERPPGKTGKSPGKERGCK